MKLAVIGTFHRRYENSFPLMHRLFVDATRKPDEAWLMCEDERDATAIWKAFGELEELDLLKSPDCHVELLPTPRKNGDYEVIPYSHKINWALDRTQADAIVYLDNGSRPGPDKYRVMLEALEEHPEWGAVYCTQKRTGYLDEVFFAKDVIGVGSGQLNYTQVMHRLTADRWPTEMRHARPDLADSIFWGKLSESLGPVYPAGGERIHDDHHMPTPDVEL